MKFSTYLQSLFAEREAALMEEMRQRAAAADRDIAEANRRAAHAEEQAAHAQKQAAHAQKQAEAAHAQEQAAHAQEQWQRYGMIEALIVILALRFDETAVQALRPTFENIQEVERLRQLLPAADQAPNLEAFLQQLAE